VLRMVVGADLRGLEGGDAFIADHDRPPWTDRVDVMTLISV